MLTAAVRLATAQDDITALLQQAQSYFESDSARNGVATLIEAAQIDPENRIAGAMLYSAIRDHVWHISQILPVRHAGAAAIEALAFSADGAKLASASASGEVFISTTEPLDEDEAAAQRITLKQEAGIALSRADSSSKARKSKATTSRAVALE